MVEGLMQRVLTQSLEEVRSFLVAELKTVMARRSVLAEADSVEYLADLLIQNMMSDAFFSKNSQGKLEDNVLATLYAEALQGDEENQRAKLKRLGDVCMFVTGFFPESLQKKLVDIDYYFGMGGLAYSQLATLYLSEIVRNMFGELSAKFRIFSAILGELSDKSGLQSNSDVLALYERWVLTGDETLRKKLIELGINAPVLVPVKSSH